MALGSAGETVGTARAVLTEWYVWSYKWVDSIINYAFIKPSTTPLYEPDVPFATATFGMGCFWASESTFGCAKGVLRTRVGYAGGVKKEPTYRSLGDHTEVTRIEYDPEVTTYNDLLELFWKNHDPTRNYSSRQYMSAIFYHDETQKGLAEKSLQEYQKGLRAPITTKIVKLELFYDAEEYHQKYRLQQLTGLYKSLENSGMKDVTKSHVAARLNGYVGGFGTLEAFDAEWSQLGLSKQQADVVHTIVQKGGVK